MVDIVNIGPNGARLFELEFKKHPESLMRLHHPDCGHCQAMEPDWEDLKKELKTNYNNNNNNNNNNNVGIFDIHADALSNINEPVLQGIKGLPTILVVKGNKSEHYNGDRSKDDMLKFCREHLNIEEKKTLLGGRKNKKRNTKKRNTKKRNTKKRNTKKRNTKKII